MVATGFRRKCDVFFKEYTSFRKKAETDIKQSENDKKKLTTAKGFDLLKVYFM